MNILREKISNKEKLVGTVVCLTDPCICEIVGNVGYDCVWIDMEHTYVSYKDVLCHLNAARSANIPSIVRLPQDDFIATKKVLDMGPDGVIFPMVRSKKEAEDLIATTLYPPLGRRGFGPMRAIGYGAEDVKAYVTEKNLDLCRFLQIEHIDMIDDLEEIVKIPYIDGFIFGPNDLSASLGDFLNVYDEKTLCAIKRAIDILKKHNKYIGLSGGMHPADIEVWSKLGLNMLFAGGDWSFLYNQAKETLNVLKNHF